MNENIEHTDWLNDYPTLNKQNKGNPFLVPGNYFEEQQEQIRTAIFAQELKENTQPHGFTVPQNYFENLQEQIESIVRLEEMRSLKTGFIVPDQFFEEQQSNITARINISEFTDQQNAFSVSNGYFEDLQKRINQKTGIKEATQPVAKVRSIFVKAAWKYATAACIAVAVTAGFFVKQYQSAHNIQNQLSNLPDADIENYLKINADTYDNHVILENSYDTDLDFKTSKASTDSNEIN